MKLIDLTGEFREIVTSARSTIEFKARFWAWVDGQRREGALAPLLNDMERHWSAVGEAPSLTEARDLLRYMPHADLPTRVDCITRRFQQVTGDLPDVSVILLAGFERPEGYSRFDRGRNTIFLGLDHPSALAHHDHLELILSHEMCHAVRDPHAAVLGDYAGSADMGHDEFVARHPFREHLVSESLATSISEACWSGRPDRRYVYFDEEAIRWCELHRRAIAERMLLALEREEPYRTFYSEGSVAPDSPDCCDYWFGLHMGRWALHVAPAGELLRMPAQAFLDRFLPAFVPAFIGEAPAASQVAAVPQEAPRPAAPMGKEALSGASLPVSVRQAYDEYAALLARRPGLARQIEEQLAEAVESSGLRFGQDSWDIHAFPLLLSAEEERHLRWATDGLMRLIESVIELYRRDREVRAFFGLPQHVEELCLLEPGYRPHVMLGRLDSYWSGRRVRFLELNANGAALWCIAELLGEQALELPGLGEILENHEAETWPLASRMLEGMLSAWHQARGAGAEPRRIAIVDWSDVSTVSEQQRLAAAFTKMGLPTDLVAPADLVFDGTTLAGPEGPIDIVYRRLTTLDLIERHQELSALFAAARAGAVVTVASWASDVAHSKRLFAFLTHERWQRTLSPAQRALVDAHVPWTRMFAPGKTQYQGRRCELRELALAERERFVLKPAESYAGQGVLLGSETEAGVWEAEVDRRYGGSHVIQEVVQAPLRLLLLPHGKRVEEVSRWLHMSQFVIGGQLAGFVSRVSQQLVLSADSDERVLPTLVLADDEGAVADQDLGPASP